MSGYPNRDHEFDLSQDTGYSRARPRERSPDPLEQQPETAQFFEHEQPHRPVPQPSQYLQVHNGEDDQFLYDGRTSFESVGEFADDIHLNDLNHSQGGHRAPYPEDYDEGVDDVSDEIGGLTGFPSADYANDYTQAQQWDDEEDQFDVQPLDPSYYERNGTMTSMGTSVDTATREEKEWERRQKKISSFKRYGTRKIKLVEGEVLSTEYKVPSAIYKAVLPRYLDEESGTNEFSHLKYTAATCDPDDFSKLPGYGLRVNDYGRETELLITITYYNEDKVLTARTLSGVMQNIRDICNMRHSQFWKEGGEAWKKIVVVLVMDGIAPCDKNTLDMLATIGLYQDGVMKKTVEDKETVAHIFEYTTQLCVTADQKLVRPQEGNKTSLPPIQMILCLKQENTKKINSHRWVFNAFCPILKPRVVCLLDAGTKPGRKSILNLWKVFYNNSKVGGACGEIHVMLGKFHRHLVNPLVATQNFEYKISNILDKPLESMFGFVSVLPGAFSAYRYAAVEGRPLEQYFHGDHTLAKRLGKKGIDGMSIFRKNMFLAEDRILCFEVVFKRGCKWKLTYVKASKAETDVPDRLPELIGQRRRWLNGSFAAGVYAMMHFYRIYRSGHNIFRMALLHVQFVYNVVQQILTWFNLGCYYLTITVIIELAANPAQFGSGNNDSALPFTTNVSQIIAIICRDAYTVFIIISFFLALGNKPKGSVWLYYLTCVVFSIISIYTNIIALWLAIRAIIMGDFSVLVAMFKSVGDIFTNPIVLVCIALLSTYGLYIISGLIYLDPWHLITCMPQYFIMMPNFVNVLNVYAFSNWHDVSWGTKGSDKVDLPTVKATKVGDVAVVEEVDRPMQDIDAQFEQVVKRALTPFVPKKEKNVTDPDDQTKRFRTYLIITWMVSNTVLVLAITSSGVTSGDSQGSDVQTRIAGFFSTLLWSNAALAVFRFIGCAHFVLKSAGRRFFSSK